MPKDPTKRFSDRVENYVKYRPSYPKKLITVLKDKRIISDNSIIADIGSGTGIFTRILLDTGCKVFAVKPNDEMRNKAEASLLHFSYFISINGQAEQTTLDSNSINVLTVAQAFHWFDLEKTRKEFLRILKPEGYLVLVWNERLIDEVLFQKEYDSLLRQYCPEYVKVSYHKVTDEQINRFYGSSQIEIFTCEKLSVF
ncbi:MAG: class I SAM-dependent methyltransferase [Candidatus Heimdallarchaeota archaeon]